MANILDLCIKSGAHSGLLIKAIFVIRDYQLVLDMTLGKIVSILRHTCSSIGYEANFQRSEVSWYLHLVQNDEDISGQSALYRGKWRRRG